MIDDQYELRRLLRNIYGCYFLSGALGLAYQILWLRKLLFVFGNTVHAVSTVLTVFFGGLALGSWLFGRLIDRHGARVGLRWYGLLEGAVGLYAFATLPLFDAIQRVYIPLYRASNFSSSVLVAATFACSALILLIPTTLLGGTFPVLSRFLIRSSEQRGAKIATLYGINTAGAMTGTLLVYYVGLPVLGLFRTLICVGLLNLGIGALCLAFDAHLQELGFLPSAAPSGRSESRRKQPEESLGEIRWLLLAFGLSGFSAMVYEVAWTRALSLILGSSIYAFCVMLATFLGGMALGSLRIRRTLRRQPATITQFIQLECWLAVYGLCSILIFGELPQCFVMLWPVFGQTFAGLSWLQVLLSSFPMFVPTFLMGVLFPVVSDLVTGRFAQLGQRLGTAYAVNTLGGIIGSFLSGFILIPRLGLPWAIATAALMNLLGGLVIFVRFGRLGSLTLRGAISVALLAVAVAITGTQVVPLWRKQVIAAGVFSTPEEYRDVSVEQSLGRVKLLFYRDSINATVTVQQLDDLIFLKVGGKTDASSGLDMGTQILSAHLPLLIHPNPKSIFVLGLGSGITLGHAGRYPLSVIHCAEIDPAVVEGARLFRRYNFGIHDDPRVRIFNGDGRNVLLASTRQYDVISSEPSNPWIAGIAALFTQEFYQLAKQRLAPGGIMCQWLHLYRMFPSDVKLILKTFHEEFPYVSVWSSIPGDLLLIGSMQPHELSCERLAQRMREPAIQEALKPVHVERPELLLQLFLLGNEEIEQLTADVAWVHRDDQPFIEFSAPKALYIGQTFHTNYDGIWRFKSTPKAIAPDYDERNEDADFYRATAELWKSRSDWTREKDALKQVVKLDPRSGQAWASLAEASLRAGEQISTEEALVNAERLSPAEPKIYRLLGRIYAVQHRLEEAQRFYLRFASLTVSDGPTAFDIAEVLREAGRFLEASEFYRSSVSQGGGSHPFVVLAYAKALNELRSWPMAEAILRFAMHNFPGDPKFPLLYGELLLKQQRLEEAEVWFKRAVTLAPKTTEPYYGLARIAVATGARERAVYYLRQVLIYNPYDLDASQLLYRLRSGGEGVAIPAASGPRSHTG